MTFVGVGAKETKTEYPTEEGLEFGTTKQREDWVLEPEESVLSKHDLERVS